MERPCKVVVPATRQFLPARTSNVSVSGALIHLAPGRTLAPGQEIEIAIAWNALGLVRSSQLIKARVVRALGTTDGEQALALCFAHSEADTQLAAVA